MKLMTITEVTRAYNVSARMLRYYDQIGLLASSRKEGYAYRVYDEEAVKHLQLIMILKKLRIPLKKIALIFSDTRQTRLLEVFQESMDRVDEEIAALETIRDVLSRLIVKLNQSEEIKPEYLNNAEIISIIQTLSLSNAAFKGEWSMEEINKANEILGKLQHVRIVMLPACTVAACHFIGENPEETAGKVVNQFVRESGLYEKKPDARMFGFNHPNPSSDRPCYGYEVWVTVPEDMAVPAPLVKKTFAGGLYAAHTITFPNFHEWKLLVRWAEENGKYVPDYSKQGDEIMGGCLEEHLNWIYSSYMGWPDQGIDGEIDLLLPVKLKKD